jgi:hypothetical protein
MRDVPTRARRHALTERHYAHLTPSYVADTICAHFPTLGIGGNDAVVPLRRQQ